jgi:ubiquinone biosynthesis protein
VRQVVETDLEIIAGVARFLDKHVERLRIYNLPEVVEEFAITIRQELDYTREGRNGDLLRQGLSDMDYVRVAETIWDHTTSRVLTLERIVGVKINDLQGMANHGYSSHAVARNLWRTYLQMVFVDGFFHADAHPGNFVVLENNVICLLDYGMVGRIEHETRTYVTMLLSRYVQEDSTGVADIVVAMGSSPPDLDRKQFSFDVDRLLRQYYGATLREVSMGGALADILRLSARYKIRLPASLGLLVKVMMGVEGMDRTLDPDYDMPAEAKPFIDRAVRGELSAEKLYGEFMHGLLYWKTLLSQMPQRTSQLLDHMAQGTFRIVFKHEGLEAPTRDIDRAANRLSLAVISAATIIASALVLQSRIGPTWRGFPAIGLVGFAIAFVFGLWLMISIIRAGNLW